MHEDLQQMERYWDRLERDERDLERYKVRKNHYHINLMRYICSIEIAVSEILVSEILVLINI